MKKSIFGKSETGIFSKIALELAQSRYMANVSKTWGRIKSALMMPVTLTFIIYNSRDSQKRGTSEHPLPGTFFVTKFSEQEVQGAGRGGVCL